MMVNLTSDGIFKLSQSPEHLILSGLDLLGHRPSEELLRHGGERDREIVPAFDHQKSPLR